MSLDFCKKVLIGVMLHGALAILDWHCPWLHACHSSETEV